MKILDLTDKEKQILQFLCKAKYATTKQISRLFFLDSIKETTALRRANLATKKLNHLGFISHLERRIGGVRAGSGSYIWTMKTAGLRALKQAGENLPISRKNKYEPTAHHLAHTLAISEVYVQLTETARKNPNFSLDLFLFEPNCWRGWLDALGGRMSLKPDAFVEISLHDYLDSYFIEVDKSTESLVRIISKCKQYIRYYNTGFEQKYNDVFPLVLWIAPNDKRKIAIQKRIQDELDNFWELFQVVSLDEFAEFVAGGIGDGK